MPSEFLCRDCEFGTFEYSLARIHNTTLNHEITLFVDPEEESIEPVIRPPRKPEPPQSHKTMCDSCYGQGYLSHTEWVGSGDNRQSVYLTDHCFSCHGSGKVDVFEPTLRVTVREWEALMKELDHNE